MFNEEIVGVISLICGLFTLFFPFTGDVLVKHKNPLKRITPRAVLS